KVDNKLVLGVEEIAPRGPARDTLIRRGRRIRLPVRPSQIESRRSPQPHLQLAHRPTPYSPLDVDLLVFATERAQNPQLRKAVPVRDVGDPFAIRRPARVEVIPVAKRHLIRLATVDWQHVEIVELRSAMRAIEHPLTVRRPRRLRAVKPRPRQDTLRLRY